MTCLSCVPRAAIAGVQATATASRLKLYKLTQSDTEVEDEVTAENLGLLLALRTEVEVIGVRQPEEPSVALPAPLTARRREGAHTPVMGLIWVAAILEETRFELLEALWELVAVAEVFWFD